jgi:sterol carrier protein 2
MVPGALASVFADRPSAMARFETARDELQAFDPQAPMAAQFFGGAVIALD